MKQALHRALQMQHQMSVMSRVGSLQKMTSPFAAMPTAGPVRFSKAFSSRSSIASALSAPPARQCVVPAATSAPAPRVARATSSHTYLFSSGGRNQVLASLSGRDALAAASPRRLATTVSAYQPTQQQQQAAPFASFPLIQTIPYDPRLENRIQVSGRLGARVEIFDTGHGQVVKVPLMVPSRTQDPNHADDVYTIECYEALAQAVANQLLVDMQINVIGRLRCDSIELGNPNPSINLVIEAQEISILDSTAPYQANFAPRQGFVAGPPPQQQQQGGFASPPQQQMQMPGSGFSPPGYSPPGFSPQPVAAGGGYAPQQGGPKPFVKLTLDEEKMVWQELHDNPSKFWDNRYNKRNPKAPDYKHKDTNAPLWIDSRVAPPWAAELREQGGS